MFSSKLQYVSGNDGTWVNYTFLSLDTIFTPPSLPSPFFTLGFRETVTVFRSLSSQEWVYFRPSVRLGFTKSDLFLSMNVIIDE